LLIPRGLGLENQDLVLHLGVLVLALDLKKQWESGHHPTLVTLWEGVIHLTLGSQ